jgi:hypothetical protein
VATNLRFLKIEFNRDESELPDLEGVVFPHLTHLRLCCCCCASLDPSGGFEARLLKSMPHLTTLWFTTSEKRETSDDDEEVIRFMLSLQRHGVRHLLFNVGSSSEWVRLRALHREELRWMQVHHLREPPEKREDLD